MVLTDPIADMLTRIRNAAKARKRTVDMPASKLKLKLAEILKSEGYISGVEEVPQKPIRQIRIELRYRNARETMIREIARVSRPGCRVYATKEEIAAWKNPIVTTILSTSRGIMTGRQAQEAGVGGEVMVTVL